MLSIHFINDGSGDEIEGNYKWGVFINNRCLAKGILKHHNRLSGWKGLLGYFAEKVESGETKDVDGNIVFTIEDEKKNLDPKMGVCKERIRYDEFWMAPKAPGSMSDEEKGP